MFVLEGMGLLKMNENMTYGEQMYQLSGFLATGTCQDPTASFNKWGFYKASSAQTTSQMEHKQCICCVWTPTDSPSYNFLYYALCPFWL